MTSVRESHFLFVRFSILFLAHHFILLHCHCYTRDNSLITRLIKDDKSCKFKHVCNRLVSESEPQGKALLPKAWLEGLILLLCIFAFFKDKFRTFNNRVESVERIGYKELSFWSNISWDRR